jgi:hypothetical protein
MITLLRGHDAVSGYAIRAWTGPATDEGVGLISMVEVSDEGARPVCRFEVFLDAMVLARRKWPPDDEAACRLLEVEALERARAAVLGGSLHELHGHRFDIDNEP